MVNAPQAQKYPCVLFALARESRPFRRALSGVERLTAPCRAWRCLSPEVLVVETGIGARAVEQALAWIFSEPKLGRACYQPSWLVFAGFAGSLADDLAIGDLVLATEVVGNDGRRTATTWPSTVLSQSPPLRRGAILSATQLIVDPNEKRRLGQTHQALAVDMESATFARLCSQRGVPFGCLRAISDDIHTPLAPELVALLAEGRVSWWRALLALARRPSLAGEFRRLARDTRVAADRLAEALGSLLSCGQGG